LAALGVPESVPVLELKLAHEGLPTIAKLSVRPLSESTTLGVKL